jgi:anthraniloyl-CoA monooxygenase
MRIACIGGGPGGLFFAALAKQADPDLEITVFERNRADDTFGFGVVFSDATLAGIDARDPVLRDALTEHGRHWDDIEVRLKGERLRCGGNGMAAIARKTLLHALQERALDVGVDLRFETEVGLDDLADYDLVVAADGANSRTRTQLADAFGPTEEVATAKFIWFGTTYMFSGLTFVHERGPHGVFAVHGYPISKDVSTFIVETDEESWRAAGLDEFDVTQPPGASDLKSKSYLEELFAEQIDGAPLLVNNSRWGNFRTRRARTWRQGNVALLGDAAHTAHFSVGSGTKMAMEDAIALADALQSHGNDVDAVLAAYEAAARPSVEKIQQSARPSLSWWEHFGRSHDALEPWQFAVHFLTRSMDVGRLGRRAPDFVESSRAAWKDRYGSDPLSTSLDLGGVTLQRRAVAIEDDPTAVTVQVDGLQVPVVQAPDDEAGVPEALDRAAHELAEPTSLVAVRGGTPLTRRLVGEELRLGRHLRVLLVDDQLSRDQAETEVLSGRADLVGGSPDSVKRWVVPA